MKQIWDILSVLIFIVVLFVPMLIIIFYYDVMTFIIKLIIRPKFRVGQKVRFMDKEGLVVSRNFQRFEESHKDRIKSNKWIYGVEYYREGKRKTESYIPERLIEESKYSMRDRELLKLLN